MHFLFVKQRLAWPRSSGHDVHCFQMIKALAGLGHEVSLLTGDEPCHDAIEGLSLVSRRTFGLMIGADNMASPLKGLQERFRSYWGIDSARIVAVRDMAEACRADAVVVVGLDVLPYLGAVEGPTRVWYAGDEWAWHHLSQFRALDPSSWANLRAAAIKGLYERAYAPLLDRVWVVSEADRRAMRRVIGHDRIDVIANGVAGDHFRPVGTREQEAETSCVFWGRLDFGPNIQALEWFCRKVWPILIREVPGARFSIYGFQATDRIRALAGGEGIGLVADLPDLRLEIARHQVVVLPFVSGGGIKNKLLEAASMGKAIVCSGHASNGLLTGDQAPLVRAKTPGEWARAIIGLWGDPDRRRRLGEEARAWVLEHHTWEAAARVAEAGLEQSMRGRRP